MITEGIRTYLYPIGFVANLLFGGRFLLQWIQSEKKRESTVTHSFWRISFFANLLMCLHGFLQFQYPIYVIQLLNAAIAWRNLNLMGNKIRSLRFVLAGMVLSVLAFSLLFFLQGNSAWMRSPTLPWSGAHASEASLPWHILGFFGMLLFASRYWLQWWLAEKHRKSFIGSSFWWISCVGAFFSLAYAIRLADPVNILGFSLGLIPYIRNLMLLKKNKRLPKTEHTHSLFIFAGEQSGDVLGANLLAALKRMSPSLDLFGVGGPEMKQAGLRAIHPMERFQVMGFSSVLASLPRLYADFKKIKKEILENNPKGVVLIDYPDFNMLLAKALRKSGYQGKVIHYVCPSVWAWRKNRVHTLAATLDHLLAILPFEEKCFHGTQLPVTFVGHPLVAAVDRHLYGAGLGLKQPIVAIFPGSRRHEIALNLPIQLEAARLLGPDYTLAVSVARPEFVELIQKYTGPSIPLIGSDQRYELMRAASCALATSGTIVLELGLHAVPTVVTYQLATFNYLLGRYAFRIRLPFYTLVNIICGKEVFPEFIHKELSSLEIFEALKQMMDHPEICKQECARLRQLLTQQDASHKAAQTIQELI